MDKEKNRAAKRMVLLNALSSPLFSEESGTSAESSEHTMNNIILFAALVLRFPLLHELLDSKYLDFNMNLDLVIQRSQNLSRTHF